MLIFLWYFLTKLHLDCVLHSQAATHPAPGCALFGAALAGAKAAPKSAHTRAGSKVNRVCNKMGKSTKNILGLPSDHLGPSELFWCHQDWMGWDGR